MHYKSVGMMCKHSNVSQKMVVLFLSRCQHGALFYGRLPFLKEKTSDELTYTQDVIEFLSHMGTKNSYYEHTKYIIYIFW